MARALVKITPEGRAGRDGEEQAASRRDHAREMFKNLHIVGDMFDNVEQADDVEFYIERQGVQISLNERDGDPVSGEFQPFEKKVRTDDQPMRAGFA